MAMTLVRTIGTGTSSGGKITVPVADYAIADGHSIVCICAVKGTYNGGTLASNVAIPGQTGGYYFWQVANKISGAGSSHVGVHVYSSASVGNVTVGMNIEWTPNSEASSASMTVIEVTGWATDGYPDMCRSIGQATGTGTAVATTGKPTPRYEVMVLNAVAVAGPSSDSWAATSPEVAIAGGGTSTVCSRGSYRFETTEGQFNGSETIGTSRLWASLQVYFEGPSPDHASSPDPVGADGSVNFSTNSITLSPSHSSGDLIVLAAASFNSHTPSPPSGFTLYLSSGYTRVWWMFADVGDTSFVVSFSGTGWQVAGALAFRSGDVNHTTPIVSAGLGSLDPASAIVTPTVDYCRIGALYKEYLESVPPGFDEGSANMLHWGQGLKFGMYDATADHQSSELIYPVVMYAVQPGPGFVPGQPLERMLIGMP